MAMKSIIATSVAAVGFAFPLTGICRAETPRQVPKEETIISTAAAKVSMLDQLMQQPLDKYTDNLLVGEELLNKDPNSVDGHKIVGMTHFYIWMHYSHDPQELEKAIAVLRHGAGIDEKNGYFNIALSEVFCALGRHDDELKELNEAVRRQSEARSPYDYRTYIYRSKNLRELGRNDEADADKRTASKLKSENSHVTKY